LTFSPTVINATPEKAIQLIQISLKEFRLDIWLHVIKDNDRKLTVFDKVLSLVSENGYKLERMQFEGGEILSIVEIFGEQSANEVFRVFDFEGEPQIQRKMSRRKSKAKEKEENENKEKNQKEKIMKSQFKAHLIDSKELMTSALKAIFAENLVAIDCEGIELGRNGKLCLIQVGLRNSEIYLFDITVLGSDAFEHFDNLSLKGFLESKNVKKIMFDPRNDSDALYHQYNISLENVYDLQLADVALRKQTTPNVQYIHGLKKVLETYLIKSTFLFEAIELKKRITHVVSSESGNKTLWDKRPLKQEMLDYAAVDVHTLFPLFDFFQGALPKNWRERVKRASQERVLERLLEFPKQGPARTLAPKFN